MLGHPLDQKPRTKLTFNESTRTSLNTPYPTDLFESAGTCDNSCDSETVSTLSSDESEVENGIGTDSLGDTLVTVLLKGLEVRKVQHDRLSRTDNTTFASMIFQKEHESFVRISRGLIENQIFDKMIPQNTHQSFNKTLIRLCIVKRHILGFLKYTIERIDQHQENTRNRPENTALLRLFKCIVSEGKPLLNSDSRPSYCGSILEDDQRSSPDEWIDTVLRLPRLPFSPKMAEIFEGLPLLTSTDLYEDKISSFHGTETELEFVQSLNKRAVMILPAHKGAYFMIKYFQDLCHTDVGGQILLNIINVIRRMEPSPTLSIWEYAEYQSLLQSLFLGFILICFIEGELKNGGSEWCGEDRLILPLLEQARSVVKSVYISPGSLENVDDSYEDGVMFLSLKLLGHCWGECDVNYSILEDLQPIVQDSGERTLVNIFNFIDVFSVLSITTSSTNTTPISPKMLDRLHKAIHLFSSLIESILKEEFIKFTDEEIRHLYVDPETCQHSTLVPGWFIKGIIWKLMMIDEHHLPRATLLGIVIKSILRPDTPIKDNIELLRRFGLARSLLYAFIVIGEEDDIDILFDVLLDEDLFSLTGMLIASSLKISIMNLSSDLEVYSRNNQDSLSAIITTLGYISSIEKNGEWALTILRNSFAIFCDGRFDKADEILSKEECSVLYYDILESIDILSHHELDAIDEVDAHVVELGHTSDLLLARFIGILFWKLVKNRNDVSEWMQKMIEILPRMELCHLSIKMKDLAINFIYSLKNRTTEEEEEEEKECIVKPLD